MASSNIRDDTGLIRLKIDHHFHPEVMRVSLNCWISEGDVRLTWTFLGSVGTDLPPIRSRTRRSRSCTSPKSSFYRRTWPERWLQCAAWGTAQRKLPGIPSRRSPSPTCTGRCPPRHPWWTRSGALLDGRLRGTSCHLKLRGDPLPSDTGSLPVTQENRNCALSEHAQLLLFFLIKKKWVKTKANKLSSNVQKIKNESLGTGSAMRPSKSPTNFLPPRLRCKQRDGAAPSLIPQRFQHPEKKPVTTTTTKKKPKPGPGSSRHVSDVS